MNAINPIDVTKPQADFDFKPVIDLVYNLKHSTASKFPGISDIFNNDYNMLIDGFDAGEENIFIDEQDSDHIFVVSSVYIDFSFKDDNENPSFTESYPAIIEIVRKNNKLKVKDIEVDASALYEDQPE